MDKEKDMAIMLEQIIGETAKICGVTVEQILGVDRTESIQSARQLAMFAARKNFMFCLPEIAAAFGKKHATVVQAVRIVKQRLKVDKEFSDLHKRLDEVLRSMMMSDRSERISEVAHFHHDRGALNIRILGDPNEMNLTMRHKGDVMTITVTTKKEDGK